MLQDKVAKLVKSKNGIIVSPDWIYRQLKDVPEKSIYAAIKAAVASGEIYKIGYGQYVGPVPPMNV